MISGLINPGDVVLLSPEVTREEYGCDLLDERGEPLKLDAKVTSIQGDWATVLIDRVFSVNRFRAPLSGVSLTLPLSWIDSVVDHQPTRWPMKGSDAIRTAKGRDSALKAESSAPAMYWEEWEIA